jgi:hypothetical protein
MFEIDSDCGYLIDRCDNNNGKGSNNEYRVQIIIFLLKFNNFKYKWNYPLLDIAQKNDI